MRHTISVLVENHFGVLARVAGLFSARGFNIDSLAVGETQDPSVSRMTIVARGDDRILDQITKQLNKLVDVIKVQNLSETDMIDRELVLVKTDASADKRGNIMQIVNTFRAKIVDVSQSCMTIEVTGGESKVEAMLTLLSPFGVREVVRTGVIAMARASELTPPARSKAKKSVKKKAKSKATV
ncbi:MAG: acetolactate synthase small subunit [Candidatus Omnitrophota bacterium]|nr:acetolactate synthase small subunit [Candidatus Omnitrophota bacterium]